MYTLALVDHDPGLFSLLEAAGWPAPVTVTLADPSEAHGDLIIWNLSQFPTPAGQLMPSVCPRDGEPGILLVWDEDVSLETIVAAFRGGAIEAISKRSQGLHAIVQAALRHFGQRQSSQASSMLLHELIDKSYVFSIVNGVLEAINHSPTLDALYLGTREYLLEVSGARACALVVNGTLIGTLPDVTLDPAFLATEKTGAQDYDVMMAEEQYVARFPLTACEKSVGHLLLTGPSTLRAQLGQVAGLVKSLSGQLGMAAASLSQMELIRHRASHDHLTGLYNRAYFAQSWQAEFERAGRYQRDLSLLIVDLDHFKAINDTCGHPQGDEILRQTGACISHSLRATDVAARYGGEEFIIILPETALDKASIVAERLRIAITQNLALDPQPVGRITASIGVAARCSSDTDPMSVLQRADTALYQAKRNGRNCAYVSLTNLPVEKGYRRITSHAMSKSYGASYSSPLARTP